MLVVWAGLALGVLLVGVPQVGAAVALGAAGDGPVAAEPLDPELGRAPEAIAVAPVPVPPRPEPARPEPAATDPAATDPTDPVALAFGVPVDFGPVLGVPTLEVAALEVAALEVAALGVATLGVATLGVPALGALGANRSGAGRDRNGAAAVVLTAGAKGQGCWGITDSGGTEGLRGLVPDRDPDPVPVPPLPPLPPRSPEPMTL